MLTVGRRRFETMQGLPSAFNGPAARGSDGLFLLRERLCQFFSAIFYFPRIISFKWQTSISTRITLFALQGLSFRGHRVNARDGSIAPASAFFAAHVHQIHEAPFSLFKPGSKHPDHHYQPPYNLAMRHRILVFLLILSLALPNLLAQYVWKSLECPHGRITNIAYGNCVFVAVNEFGDIFRSADEGETWTQHPAVINRNGKIIYTGTHLAIGNGGKFATSPYGNSWMVIQANPKNSENPGGDSFWRTHKVFARNILRGKLLATSKPF